MWFANFRLAAQYSANSLGEKDSDPRGAESDLVSGPALGREGGRSLDSCDPLRFFEVAREEKVCSVAIN